MQELLINYLQHWMEFSNTLNASITAGWVTLAVLLLRLVLKKAPKWLHVSLWSLVALRLILPFSLESSVSVLPAADIFPKMQSYEQMQEPAVLDVVYNPLYESVSIELGRSVDRVSIWLLKMTHVWLIGVAVMLLYAVCSYVWLRWRVRAAVRRHTNLYESEYVQTPFVLGWLRPRIYLPAGIPEDTLFFVIAHEDAHIRRRDHWWKPLGFILLCFHWFNPLLWLAYVLFCRDIEQACDEKVLKELGGERRADYAQALLNCTAQRWIPAACPLSFGETDVKTRIRSVLHYKKPVFWITLLCVVLCLAAAVTLLTDPFSVPDPSKVVGPYDISGLGGDFLQSGNSVYAVGANAYGMPVFQNADAAFSAFAEEYAAGIEEIRTAWQLDPIRKRDYTAYKNYGWQTPCADEELNRQCHQVTLFLDLYENSFDRTPRTEVRATLPSAVDFDLSEEIAQLPQVLQTFPVKDTKEMQTWPVGMAAPFIPQGTECTSISATNRIVYIDYRDDDYRYIVEYHADGMVRMAVGETAAWSPDEVTVWSVSSEAPGTVKVSYSSDGMFQAMNQVLRYRGGELLGMSMALSYVPEDGSYYASIELCGDRLTVTDDAGKVLYDGTGPAASSYSHGALLTMLANDWTGVPEEKIPAYDTTEDMTVYSWPSMEEDRPAYSIWCFYGRPTWFAEGEMMRIYTLEPVG